MSGRDYRHSQKINLNNSTVSDSVFGTRVRGYMYLRVLEAVAAPASKFGGQRKGGKRTFKGEESGKKCYFCHFHAEIIKFGILLTHLSFLGGQENIEGQSSWGDYLSTWEWMPITADKKPEKHNGRKKADILFDYLHMHNLNSCDHVCLGWSIHLNLPVHQQHQL